jgi:hypothetical protein
LKVFNEGEISRFYFYGVYNCGCDLCDHKEIDISLSSSYCRILNVGDLKPIYLMEFISPMEFNKGKNCKRILSDANR